MNIILTDSEEEALHNTVLYLRDEARMNWDIGLNTPNKDARELYKDVAQRALDRSNALISIARKIGIRGFPMELAPFKEPETNQ